MRSALLDKRVHIEKRTRTRDPGTGELVDSWASMGEVWAEMMEGRVLERYTSAQKVAEIDVGYRMRYAPALLTLTPDEHRLRRGDLIYDIKGVVEIQRRRGVIAMCAARTEGLTAQGVPPEAP